MNEENEPRRQDEGVSSTHARTIARACRYQAGPQFRGTVRKQSQRRIGSGRQGQVLIRAMGWRGYRRVIDLMKKPAASGASRRTTIFRTRKKVPAAFLVRLGGVSTTTWTYMSPYERAENRPHFDAMRNAGRRFPMGLYLGLALVVVAPRIRAQRRRNHRSEKQQCDRRRRAKEQFVASDRKMYNRRRPPRHRPRFRLQPDARAVFQALRNIAEKVRSRVNPTRTRT